jgi:hypothetical protein
MPDTEGLVSHLHRAHLSQAKNEDNCLIFLDPSLRFQRPRGIVYWTSN